MNLLSCSAYTGEIRLIIFIVQINWSITYGNGKNFQNVTHFWVIFPMFKNTARLIK